MMLTFFHLHMTGKRLRALSLCIWRYIKYCILLLFLDLTEHSQCVCVILLIGKQIQDRILVYGKLPFNIN